MHRKTQCVFGFVVSAFLLTTQPALADKAGSDAWHVRAGSSLHDVLQGWSQRQGWEFVWDAPGDYRLRASAVLHGDFENAVTTLADAVSQTNPDLNVTLYQGNRVLHVHHAAPHHR